MRTLPPIKINGEVTIFCRGRANRFDPSLTFREALREIKQTFAVAYVTVKDDQGHEYGQDDLDRSLESLGVSELYISQKDEGN